MILNDDEIKERIESPLNLLNRLRTTLNRASSIIPVPSGSTSIPQLPPKSSDIIENLEDKINNTTARSKAMSIMLSAMDELDKRIPEIQKPEKLASIAAEMSKVISHQDSRSAGDKMTSQIIVYAPQVQSIENFEVIEVSE